jgi:hypothetical protein
MDHSSWFIVKAKAIALPCFFNVSKKASAKSGENNGGLVRLRGIANFA